ncbi:hypothetical protein HDU86_004150, partial [Geranomyces michiganensis]
MSATGTGPLTRGALARASSQAPTQGIPELPKSVISRPDGGPEISGNSTLLDATHNRTMAAATGGRSELDAVDRRVSRERLYQSRSSATEELLVQLLEQQCRTDATMTAMLEQVARSNANVSTLLESNNFGASLITISEQIAGLRNDLMTAPQAELEARGLEESSE